MLKRPQLLVVIEKMLYLMKNIEIYLKGKRVMREDKLSDDGNSLMSEDSLTGHSKNRPSSSGKESLQVPSEPKTAVPDARSQGLGQMKNMLRRLPTVSET